MHWSWLVVVYAGVASTHASLRIGIVGGGFAGTSAAWFLSKSNPGIAIDIFEADKLGGRARELSYQDHVFELGASIAWEKNFLIRNAAKELGVGIQWLNGDSSENQQCKQRQQDAAGAEDDDGEDGLAVWDGNKFVMQQVSGNLWETMSLLWRYGPSAYSYGQHAIKVWQDYFQPIYELQDNGTFFKTPDELLQLTGLWEFTQRNCKQHMQSVLDHWYLWGTSHFIEELAGGINRCNYNQMSSTMNALAGLVSYLPAAADRVFAIKGGNSLLTVAMAHAANATINEGSKVAYVEQESDGLFSLATESSEGLKQWGPYDAVVIASPLELSGVQLKLLDEQRKEDVSGLSSGMAANPVNLGTRQYQTTVTTFVIGGQLQANPFGLDELPNAQSVLVTEHAKTDFSSISMVKRIGKERVYKVFSDAPLPAERILELFGADAKVLDFKVWSAYPQFAPPERFSPFHLAPGLCYSSALENSASAMEVAMIAGRNCALLITDQLKQTREAAADIAQQHTLQTGASAVASETVDAAAAA